MGLFEISPGHELHRMTQMLQEGLWAATQVSMDNPPKVNGQSIPCYSNPKGEVQLAICLANTVTLGIRETYEKEGGRKQKFWGGKLESLGGMKGLPASSGGCVLQVGLSLSLSLGFSIPICIMGGGVTTHWLLSTPQILLACRVNKGPYPHPA